MGLGLTLCASLASAALTPPLPAELQEGNGIIKDRNAAIALGKALFWDKNSGSDGMACAGCHFSAGADSRIVNQLSPGLLRQPTEDKTFGSITNFDGEIFVPVPGAGVTKSGGTVDSTYELKPGDFPFHNTTDHKNRNAPLLITTNDVVSSSGSFDTAFGRMAGKSGTEKCNQALADVFHASGRAARQVEPRNTPTTINAVFNHRNFWDGRANNIFNGVGVFGKRDIAGNPNARLIILEGDQPVLGHLGIKNASLASQAVGPPLSALEMSCDGRTFADVGRRLLSSASRPLETQHVRPNDSVLGGMVHSSGRGLANQHSYENLIKKAFDEKYWAANGTFRIVNGQLEKVTSGNGVAGGGYTQAEINFPMFWGLSIMLYEATLVSDQSPFDTWFALCNPRVTNPGDPLAVPIANPVVQCRDAANVVLPGVNPATLVPGFGTAEVMGFGLFTGGGVGIRNPGSPACSGCHNLPLFSEAQFQAGANFVSVERSRIDNRGAGTPTVIEGGVHDRGFFNIGSRATSFDLGAGGLDPYGNSLSLARMFVAEQGGLSVTDPSGITDACNTPGLIEPGGTPRYPGCDASLATTTDHVDPSFNWSFERELVDASFKTPTIRNVALTPPYFHYGGYSDLRSVMDFYARGGNHRNKSHVNAGYTGDTSGSGFHGKGPVPATGPDFGTNVDFFVKDLKSTDEQIDAMVAFMMAVTDPRVQCDAAPFDHPELPVPVGVTSTDSNNDGRADDVMAVIPAVGAGGYQAEGSNNLCLPNSGDLFDPNLRNRLIVQ